MSNYADINMTLDHLADTLKFVTDKFKETHDPETAACAMILAKLTLQEAAVADRQLEDMIKKV